MLEAELSRRAKRLEKENSSGARRIRRSRRKQERQRKEREKELEIEREKRRAERERKEREEGRVSRLVERVNEAYDRIAPKVTGLRRVSTEFTQEMRELDRVADLRAKLLSKRFALVRAIDRIRSWTCLYCTRLNPPDVKECMSCTSASPIRDDEKIITIDELVQRLKESETYHLFKDSDFLDDDENEDGGVVVLEKKPVVSPPPPGKHSYGSVINK